MKIDTNLKYLPSEDLFNEIYDLHVGSGHCGRDLLKNGHILPRGQWYAPSAVINDVLIMPEYARVCQSMPEYD